MSLQSRFRPKITHLLPNFLASSTSSHFFLVSYPWWLPPLPLLQAPPWRPGFCTAPRSSTVAQRRTRRPCAAAARRAKLGAWRNASRGASRAPRSRSLGKWWEKDGEIYGEREIYIYGEKSGEDSGMKYMNMIISTIFVLGDLNTNLIFWSKIWGKDVGWNWDLTKVELQVDLMNFMVWELQEKTVMQWWFKFPIVFPYWYDFREIGLKMEGCSGAHGDESNLAMADTDEPQSLEIFGKYSPRRTWI